MIIIINAWEHILGLVKELKDLMINEEYKIYYKRGKNLCPIEDITIDTNFISFKIGKEENPFFKIEILNNTRGFFVFWNKIKFIKPTDIKDTGYIFP